MFDVFLSSVCTCFRFLSSNLLNWEEREVAWSDESKKSELSLVNCNTWPSLPRLPDGTFWGEPPDFLIKLNGEDRSLLRGPGRDWKMFQLHIVEVYQSSSREALMFTCVLPNPRLVTRESKLCCSCFALCSRQHFEQRPDQAGLPKKPQPDLQSSSDFSTLSLPSTCSAPAAILLAHLLSETAVEAVETRGCYTRVEYHNLE